MCEHHVGAGGGIPEREGTEETECEIIKDFMRQPKGRETSEGKWGNQCSILCNREKTAHFQVLEDTCLILENGFWGEETA